MLEREMIGPVEKLKVGRAFLGRGLYFTTAYRIGRVLIDSGCAHTAAEMVAALEAGPAPALLLNTHGHEDHIGANGPLQARHNLRIEAHPLALPVMEAPRQRQPQHLYRRLFWGYPEPARGHPIGALVEAEGVRFRVVPTPGHSSDHLSFYEPDRGWLFSGDAFIGGLDRELRQQADAWQIIASLRRLQELDAEILFPGSGTVYHRPAPVLQQKISYLEELGARIRELAAEGRSPRRILRTLFGRERLIGWVTAGDFSSLNLVRSFLGTTG